MSMDATSNVPDPTDVSAEANAETDPIRFGDTPVRNLHHMAILLAATDNPSERDKLVGDFLLAHEPLARSLSLKGCDRHRIDRNTWAGDLASVVRMVMFDLLNEVAADPDKAAEIMSITAIVGFRSKSKMTAFLESSAGLNQASKMVGQQRRMREAARVRSELTQMLGRDPRDEEIMETFNTQMLARRKNAKKQGMLLTLEHLRAVSTNLSLDDLDPTAPAEEREENHFTEWEWQAMFSKVHTTCDEESEHLGQVARMWLSVDTIVGEGKPAPATEIARALGLKVQDVRAMVEKVHELTKAVLVYNGFVPQQPSASDEQVSA